MTEPLVSCLCATYGRPVLLGEAVKCFIDQDYPNKELIIVNDQEGVDLRLSGEFRDNIKIYTHPNRFPNLGKKRNYGFDLTHGEYICIWDDDDLYAPHRISESVRLMKSRDNYDIIKTRSAFMSIHNKDYKIVSNLFHSQSIITREYFEKNRYPDKSVGEDIDFESKARVGSIDVIPWYVYRWGLNIHHLSGISDEKQSWEKSLKFEPYKKLIGMITVNPEFQNDYWQDISIFLRKNNVGWGKQWDKLLEF